MASSLICKLFQKKIYDLLSQKNYLFIFLFLIFIVLISILHFGETSLEWSREKYHAVFNRFSDNINEKSYQTRLCQYLPIDIVYTWVNGTDPLHYQQLSQTIHKLKLNSSIKEDCSFSHCVESHMLIVRPQIDYSIPISFFQHEFPHISHLTNYSLHNISVLVFDNNVDSIASLRRGYFTYLGTNYSLHPAYLTDTSYYHHTVELPDVVLGLDVASRFTSDHIYKSFSKSYSKHIKLIYQQPSKSIAILVLNQNTSATSFTQDLSNITLDINIIQLKPAYLVVQPLTENEDISASRFTDNEELRYSLRSLEMFAPWVHRVFLVSNGQIPYWLNLDHPKLTIVTHEEIFANKSHLPSFSSPAIETHLYKIPNLSKKFIYLNDDVMFGKPVLPEDFYTNSKGQKIYLSWPVPDCSEGCPPSWIQDGFCDSSCNNSNCQWDGGDCSGDVAQVLLRNNFRHRSHSNFLQDDDLGGDFCDPNCANSWLGDHYCDQSCNTFQCAYDAGDCGTYNYERLKSLDLEDEINHYFLPEGVHAAYFNLSLFLKSEVTIFGGNYERNSNVRTVVLCQKFEVLTIVFNKGFNTSINLTLEIKNPEKLKNIFIQSNQRLEVTTSKQPSSSSSTISIPTIPFEKKFPKKIRIEKLIINELDSNVSIGLERKIDYLKNLLEEGFLTLKGYKLKKEELLSLNTSSLSLKRNVSQFLETERRKENTNKYMTESYHARNLLDTFGDSLRHVNKIYNAAFGNEVRKVPAHIAHLIDVDIMTRLQEKLPDEFDSTSSHQIRTGEDMQFSFSYYYFLMNEKENLSISEIFDMFDTDKSLTWSEREIQTFLLRIHEFPLVEEDMKIFEEIIKNCSLNNEAQQNISTLISKHYSDPNLSLVSKQFFIDCPPLNGFIPNKFRLQNKNKFEILGEEEVAFKMIHTNVSKVFQQVNSVRKSPKKFICFNDNIKHGSKDAPMVQAILKDYYESLYPMRSRFELPPQFQNKYLTVNELKRWQHNTRKVKLLIYSTFAALLFLAIFILAILNCRQRKIRMKLKSYQV